MKRMLINATHSDEIRVALADGQKLYNLDIDVPGEDRKKGNIYKGKITRVEPSLEAAFVEYGGNRHGFLPYKEISRNYYTDKSNKAKERQPINIAVKEGTEVIIQVTKEERGNKGAAITTYISLAGRYLVFMPENPKAGGISRRIEGKARQDLKATLNKITQPKNSGIIVRTAGIGRSSEELDWDLNYLDQVWTAIKAAAANRKAPCFLYQESDISIRALRDYFQPDIGEILIDSKEIYEKIRDFMQQVMPHNLKKLSYYNDTIPLFSRYQIENQIQTAFAREVRLPSGGSIVIDQTEAMIAIDINSARSTKGADIEETALNTNLEAADEIARQLRIRDLGGLVVIDFIDMRNSKNQRSVEQQLNEAVSNDRARTQTTKISKFGLLEMSRQRLKSSINEASQFPCPRCSGHGFIRNIESLSVSILRILEEEALKPGTGKVIAQVPTKVANFITNEKRLELANLESRHSVPMLIVANEHFQSPQYDITRLKKAEAKNFDNNNVVLKKPEDEEEAENRSRQESHLNRPKAAVDILVHDAQAPKRISKQSSGGLFTWIKSLFSSDKDDTNTNNKPQHNNKQKRKPYNKKTQHNKQNHTHKQNKQNNNHNNRSKYNKPKAKVPQHNNQNKTANKPKHPQQKKNVNHNATGKNNQKKVHKPVQQQVKKAENNNLNEEKLIQRPLGSVASYAANKAKTEAQKKQTSPEKDNSIPKIDTAKKDTPKKEIPKKVAPIKEVTKKEVLEKDAPIKEVTKKNTPKKVASKKETPKKVTPKKETPKKESPKKEAHKKETSKKEAAKKETPKKLAPKKEVSKTAKPLKKKKPMIDPSSHIDFDI